MNVVWHPDAMDDWRRLSLADATKVDAAVQIVFDAWDKAYALTRSV